MQTKVNPYIDIDDKEDVSESLPDSNSEKTVPSSLSPEEQECALKMARNKKRTGRPKKGSPKSEPRKQVNIKCPEKLAIKFKDLSVATAIPQIDLFEEAVNLLYHKHRTK